MPSARRELRELALLLRIPTYQCPASPSSADPNPTYPTTYIAPGNDAFAPPASGSTSKNIFGAKLYPTIPCNVTGWVADYARFGAGILSCECRALEFRYAVQIFKIT